MYALRLEPPPPITTDSDWFVVPIGGGVTHWCPDCAEGQVEELLDAGAWTTPADEVDPCEVCGRISTVEQRCDVVP